MKVVVDRFKCIGAAPCVVIAAKTFQLDADGKAEVIGVEKKKQTAEESSGVMTVNNDARDVVLEAARSCPVNAISLLEDDGTPIAL